MHAVGVHSALAIRRERKRRAEQQRARERRFSGQSTESGLTSPHCSTGSLERRRSRRAPAHDNDVVSSIGMLHLGVVFLVLGIFLLGSGFLPKDWSWSSIRPQSWVNELVFIGLFSTLLGGFLVGLHKYLTRTEEEALENYVQRQLTRSRSGHRLERDVETGGMLTKSNKRAKLVEPLPGSPIVKSPPPVFTDARGHVFINNMAINGEAMRESPLEQIIEEDSLASEDTRRMDTFNRETYSATSTAPSLSPGTPSDTKYLLPNGRNMIMSQM